MNAKIYKLLYLVNIKRRYMLGAYPKSYISRIKLKLKLYFIDIKIRKQAAKLKDSEIIEILNQGDMFTYYNALEYEILSFRPKIRAISPAYKLIKKLGLKS